MKNKKILLLIILVLAMMVVFSSCNFFFGLLDENEEAKTPLDDSLLVEHSDNPLTIGFFDGVLTAFWDSYKGYNSYTLEIQCNGIKKEINTSTTSVNLEEYGYRYIDSINLALYGKTLTSKDLLDNHIYYSLTKAQYEKYTADFDGGWKDLDRFISCREELFELFSYMVIFRPNQSFYDDTYNVTEDVYFGYDFLDLYDDLDVQKAFEYEMYATTLSYEDSAGYTYSYNYNANKTAQINLSFKYDVYPTKNTTTNTTYKNAIGSETPHYSFDKENSRIFPIDSNLNTVVVNSSDQLYYALKSGYKPLPNPSTNAEFIYNQMRSILSKINTNITLDKDKIHNIYDYLVNTVIYDYAYVDTLKTTDEKDITTLFPYKCLYLEGVFGFENNKTFNANSCVAICDGISKAFTCLATIEGIDNYKVTGKANGTEHSWNKVKINNWWYLVDATWGNQLNKTTNLEYLSHDYLLVDDDLAHIEDPWYDYPEANFGNILFPRK